MRLAAVAALGRVSQQHMAALGEDHVVRGDAQVRDGGHDVRVRLGVVGRRLAVREGCRRREPRVRGADVGHGAAPFVVGGRVGDGHVFFDDGDVFLRG